MLLDAAAFVPTNRLDLRAVTPDFVAVSFYKMFGYPTGVGCLLIRNAALAKLRRPWFAGGTVNFATVQGRGHVLAPREAGFEDGTLNYLSIPAVEIGLRHLERIGIDTIQTRDRLPHRLAAERAARAAPRQRAAAGPHLRTGDRRSARRDGHDEFLRSRRTPARLPARSRSWPAHEGISLRTGCFCNPGAGETAEGLTEDDMRAGLRRRRGPHAAAVSPGDAAARRQERRRDPRLARAGQQLRRRRSLPAVRRRLPRPDAGRASACSRSTIANCRVIRDGS